jgi:hypothetical protein
MSKIYLHQMKLRKWFPPKDRFAACVMRICILREDLFIEMAGVHATQIKRLDGHSVLWRRIAFEELSQDVSNFVQPSNLDNARVHRRFQPLTHSSGFNLTYSVS